MNSRLPRRFLNRLNATSLAGAVLRSVRISAGPMRGIDPQCMELAWRALGQSAVTLKLNVLPWHMHCDDCGHHWSQVELGNHCLCGSSRVRPLGGDQLKLMSIEVDDAPASRSELCKSR